MKWLALMVVGLSGCATTSTQFVSRGELEQIAAQPIPVAKDYGKTVDVERWALVGPFPDSYALAPHSAGTPWASALLAKTKVPSGNAECAARELAHFVAVHDGFPTDELQRFIGARCGLSARFTYRSTTGETPPEMDDAAVWQHFSASVDKALAQLPAELPSGISLQRAGNRSSVVVVMTLPATRLEPVPFRPAADGTVTIVGTVNESAERVTGLVNKGEVGVERCVEDETVALPRFALRCPTLASDAVTQISVSLLPPGRLLGHEAVRLQVYPGGEPPNEWVRSSRPLSGDFLAALNAVRGAANLPAMRLETKQSAFAAKLLPHLRGDEPSLHDRIAIGMMAGWDVEGAVGRGDFSYDSVVGDSELSLLREMLESPGGRSTLLDPQATALAFALDRTDGRVHGMVSSYQMMAELPQDAAVRAVLQTLNQKRQLAGKAPVQWLTLGGFESELVQKVNATEWSPDEGLGEFLDHASNAQRVGLRGWHISANTLDDIHFPDDMLKADALSLYVAVARSRPKGQPWFVHHVLVVYPDARSFAGLPVTAPVATTPSFRAPDAQSHAG